MKISLTIIIATLFLASCASKGGDKTASPVQGDVVTYRTDQVYSTTVIDTSCPDLVPRNSFSDGAAAMLKLSGDLAFFEFKNKLAGGKDQVLSDATRKKILWDFSKNYVWLPMSFEQAYGSKEHESWVKSGYLLPRSKSNSRYYDNADELLASLVGAINGAHDYKFEIFVHKKADTRALAMPGGRIYIYRGLLDYKNSKGGAPGNQAKHDQALFILAHELTHVLQRHQTKHLQVRLMDVIDLKDTLAKMNEINSGKDNANLLSAILLGKKQFIRNYMDQELHADSCGVRLSYQAMQNDRSRLKRGLQTFLTELQSRGADKDSSLNDKNKGNYSIDEAYKLVSSPIAQHPTSRDREAKLAETYNSL